MRVRIIQLAGNNGVGKSYWLHKVLNSTLVVEKKKLNNNRKPIAYYGYNNGSPIAIIGRFEGTESGTDAVKSLSELRQLIDEFIDKPIGSQKPMRIIFEGLMASHSWGLLIPYKRKGYSVVCIFIDESPEVSIRNVETRRGSPLTQHQKDRIIRRYRNLTSCHKKREKYIPCVKVNSSKVGETLEKLGLCLMKDHSEV